jgi:hypothetical protein
LLFSAPCFFICVYLCSSVSHFRFLSLAKSYPCSSAFIRVPFSPLSLSLLPIHLCSSVFICVPIKAVKREELGVRGKDFFYLRHLRHFLICTYLCSSDPCPVKFSGEVSARPTVWPSPVVRPDGTAWPHARIVPRIVSRWAVRRRSSGAEPTWPGCRRS